MQDLAYERAVVEHADAVADALAAEPAAPVPACPGWDVAKLALHVGLVHVWAAAQVRSGSHAGVDQRGLPRAPGGPERVAWLRDAARDLARALQESPRDRPAGRWRGIEVDSGFWRRRVAQETAVHRVDADRAVGRVTVLDGALAADGVDEVADLFLPLGDPLDDGHRPAGALHLVRDDGPGRWSLAVRADGRPVRAEGGPAGDARPSVTVTGPAASLLLVCWGRADAEPMRTAGDGTLLAAWSSILGW